jgi:hypothetical protein
LNRCLFNLSIVDNIVFLNIVPSPLFARMIHNYFRWRLILTYIEDLSYAYVHVYRVFLDAYYGYALHTSNDAYCTGEVIRRFPLAIQRLYTMNTMTSAHPTSTANVNR